MLFYRRRGRSPTARARARRRAPHSPHRTNDVFRGVFRDHRAMRVRRLAGASIHRGARVLRAAIFGRATRDARARDARRRRRWECDVTLDGARDARGDGRDVRRHPGGGRLIPSRVGGGVARCGARGRRARDGDAGKWLREIYAREDGARGRRARDETTDDARD